MYTHFNKHDSSITDAQDTLLQKRMPGKMGNIRLGDMLLDERDKEGNSIDAPPGKLQNYIAEPEYQKGDIWIPTMSPTARLQQGIRQIREYSLAHPRLTLAFDGITSDFVSPISTDSEKYETYNPKNNLSKGFSKVAILPW
jgi:hypothetical protein